MNLFQAFRRGSGEEMVAIGIGCMDESFFKTFGYLVIIDMYARKIELLADC